MRVLVHVSGLQEVQANLQRFPELAKKHYADAVRQGAQTLRDETQRLPPVSKERTGFFAKGIPVAPKYGGTLRQSLTVRQIQQLAAGVYPGAHYGVFVHQGTRRMPARPFFEWALKDFGVLQKIDKVFDQASDRIARG